jgi:hypothetical protein
MAQLPLNLPDLTDAEIATLRASFTAIKNVLSPKFINLEPRDRQKYGSVNEKSKLVINKVKDYRDNMPNLSNADINWANFQKYYTTRRNYMMVIDLLNEVHELCNDPRTLVDYVLFGQARQDYKWTKYKAEDDGGGASGYEAKYNELKQFFVNDKGEDISNEEDDTPPPAN